MGTVLADNVSQGGAGGDPIPHRSAVGPWSAHLLLHDGRTTTCLLQSKPTRAAARKANRRSPTSTCN